MNSVVAGEPFGGNFQAFVIATITVVGTFVYILTVTILGRPTDPTILPILAGAIGTAFSFFFSGHIANGAAGKALDALVQTGKDREVAVAAATAVTNGSTPPVPPAPPQ